MEFLLFYSVLKDVAEKAGADEQVNLLDHKT